MFEMLVMLVIVRTVASNFVEVMWPRMRMCVMYYTGRLTSERTDLCSFEMQCGLSPPASTFDDYLEMMIQFGYVTLFAQAFPLASVVAMVNNMFEKCIDATKRLKLSKHEFYVGASSIGVW